MVNYAKSGISGLILSCIHRLARSGLLGMHGEYVLNHATLVLARELGYASMTL